MLERSDEQLIELVLDGHDPAFEVLFDRHVADSLWYAREVLGSWGEAEEAVRHSFAAAHAYLETRGRGTEFLPWLHTILGNYCLSILQARTPGPKQSEDVATVVDLGEWRLRRKLFGIALPVAPSGLRDAVMAAGGISAGAAGAGVPLLGGTVAKLAMVAVLAGGVGVAGDAASDRGASADPGVRVTEARMLATAGDAPLGADPPPRGSAMPGHDLAGTTRDVSRGAREGFTPQGPVPAAQSPKATTPADSGEAAAPAPAATAPTTADAPAPSVESTLRHVADAVVPPPAPAAEVLPEVEQPPPLDLPTIGDDLGVSALTPPVDVEALLSQGTDVLLD